ncbi:MAG: FtsX-like permease family protein [Lachnospiraceae bacterium]|nr:FtsX-like permease family protein [Lachnospiraceae bacterium]
MKMINTLAVSRIKYNKSRTILTVISIMLTTVLLMGLGTSAVALVDINRQQAVFSGNTHARLLSLSEEQVMMLSSHMDVEALRIRNTFATVEYEKMNGILTFSKDLKEGIYQGIGNIIEGRAAESADEIYGPSAFFERMGVEAKIGNKITISFRVNGEGFVQTREFTICGLVSQVDMSNVDVSDSRIVYGAVISEALVDEYIDAKERIYDASIRVYGEDELSYDKMKEKIEVVAQNIGCDKVNIDLNGQYLYTMTDPGTEIASIVGAIALIIIIFSGLVIYSIYYVSVITDVQEIGKLKAIGASDKQIRKLLLSEGLRVAVLAIPIGLLIGYFIPYFAFPVVIKRVLEVSVTAVPVGSLNMFSLPITLLVAAVVVITVVISLLKPMKMAAKVSPIEAIRYQESSSSAKIRKGNKSVSVFKLSAANLIRNKKRTLVTIITMGLSCVLFMTLAGVMSSMSSEDIARRNIDKGDFRLSLDYSANDKEYPENNLDYLQQENIFNKEFVETIEKIDGVKSVERGHNLLVGSDFPSEAFKDGRRERIIYMDREEAAEYKSEVKKGEIDYDKMIAENGVIFGGNIFMDEYGFKIGDIVELKVYDGNRQFSFTVKIMAAIDIAHGFFILPKEVWDGLGLEFDTTTDLYIGVDNAKYESVKESLEKIADTRDYFVLYSMDEELNLGKMSTAMVKYPMYLILIIIAVIGFMNLINTMITSIVTRKREFGILQAIGLSDRQLIKMLAGEGMVFTAGTLISSVTIGNLFGYQAFLWAKENHFMSLSRYHYPLAETITLALALILGQLLLTNFIGKSVRKQSLIDRIRSGE